MDSRLDSVIYAHYRAPFTPDLVWELRNLSGTALLDRPKDEWAARFTQRMDSTQWLGPIGFTYTAPELGFPSDYKFDVNMNLKQSYRHQFRTGRWVKYPLFEKSGLGWFKAQADCSSRLSFENAQHMAWFIRTVRRVLSPLDADYVFGDHMSMTAKHMGLEPREMMWPLVYFPPEMMDRLGREKFAAVPAYSVEEDKELGGGVWVQATENPFTATKADLKPLAKHFGLKVPR